MTCYIFSRFFVVVISNFVTRDIVAVAKPAKLVECPSFAFNFVY